jgi:NAD(P)-dependent dehydrogenase (short-subunit alcohol dehydrogenase family)
VIWPIRAFGRVDVLMNNAGISEHADEAWRGLEAWKRVLDANLWGVVSRHFGMRFSAFERT